MFLSSNVGSSGSTLHGGLSTNCVNMHPAVFRSLIHPKKSSFGASKNLNLGWKNTLFLALDIKRDFKRILKLQCFILYFITWLSKASAFHLVFLYRQQSLWIIFYLLQLQHLQAFITDEKLEQSQEASALSKGPTWLKKMSRLWIISPPMKIFKLKKNNPQLINCQSIPKTPSGTHSPGKSLTMTSTGSPSHINIEKFLLPLSVFPRSSLDWRGVVALQAPNRSS